MVAYDEVIGCGCKMRIDLNSDLGEGFGPWAMGDDRAMLQVVSSANIACGFHAGDPEGLLAVLRQVKAEGVVAGAHVGYRDLVGFGRRNMQVPYETLLCDVIYQIGALQALARVAGVEVRYVKPHGALYNTISQGGAQAEAVIAGIRALDPDLTLMALAGSPIVGMARASGLDVVEEMFADRAYRADGTLVDRREPGAVLHDPAEIAARILTYVETGKMRTIDGEDIAISAQSVCTHGDTPAAVAIARDLRRALSDRGIAVKSFMDA